MHLTTEGRNPASEIIDSLSSLEIERLRRPPAARVVRRPLDFGRGDGRMTNAVSMDRVHASGKWKVPE